MIITQEMPRTSSRHFDFDMFRTEMGKINTTPVSDAIFEISARLANLSCEEVEDLKDLTNDYRTMLGKHAATWVRFLATTLYNLHRARVSPSPPERQMEDHAREASLDSRPAFQMFHFTPVVDQRYTDLESKLLLAEQERVRLKDQNRAFKLRWEHTTDVLKRLVTDRDKTIEELQSMLAGQWSAPENHGNSSEPDRLEVLGTAAVAAGPHDGVPVRQANIAPKLNPDFLQGIGSFQTKLEDLFSELAIVEGPDAYLSFMNAQDPEQIAQTAKSIINLEAMIRKLRLTVNATAVPESSSIPQISNNGYSPHRRTAFRDIMTDARVPDSEGSYLDRDHDGQTVNTTSANGHVVRSYNPRSGKALIRRQLPVKRSYAEMDNNSDSSETLDDMAADLSMEKGKDRAE